MICKNQNCKHSNQRHDGKGYDMAVCSSNIYVDGWNDDLQKEQRLVYPCRCEEFEETEKFK